MLALRYVALLALVIWIGGLIALGAIAAPVSFDVTAARHLPERGDHSSKPGIGAGLEESPVPLFVQVDAAVNVAPGGGQLPVNLA